MRCRGHGAGRGSPERTFVAPYEIQGYHVTGLEAVYQVVEHFGLHYGQIAYISKSLTGAISAFIES